MIEVIKELGEIVKDLPDLAVWILCGLLFYKVFLIGGAYSLAKFFINKLYTYLVAEKKIVIKENVKVVSLDGKIITNAHDKFMALIEEMRPFHNSRVGAGTYRSDYVHSSDIEFAIEAIREKREREKANN